MRRGPEIRHDYQKLLETNLFHCALCTLTEVSETTNNIEMVDTLNCTEHTNRQQTMHNVPPVKESLYDLCTNRIACQIWDSDEVISPKEQHTGLRGLSKSNNYKLLTESLFGKFQLQMSQMPNPLPMYSICLTTTKKNMHSNLLKKTNNSPPTPQALSSYRRVSSLWLSCLNLLCRTAICSNETSNTNNFYVAT